ncbi:PRC-barrel domain-containing protein [Aquibacillus rhizosphaerae]|uniref:PRC-barrel domain-containing protein n=1 Tax=Aquibacillus rhizosphaerae TaxID=3051431 RepID=A0ABT7L7S6_9BACI|nr:PRC-barrel domain-containing protein [Aquibacillus sp. LR5S19]MDL4841908.1 PRC-barrel domain-containing protein [Aquibacillus sp. LR5S19]
MLHFSNRIQEFKVQATDDELGKVKDIYFDEDNWVVRYLVVDTKKWLPGRKVLVSPISFDYVDYDNSKVAIFESKDSIKNSPTIDEKKPVSRKHELEVNSYFGWPLYWNGLGTNNTLWGGFDTPQELNRINRAEDALPVEQEEETKLRSVKEIKGDFNGYTIQASDGQIGHITDFIIDDYNWKLRYFIVETRNWLPGKFIMLSVDWIEDISWPDSKVFVDLPKEVIKNGPFLNIESPITREDEINLYDYYQKTPYF